MPARTKAPSKPMKSAATQMATSSIAPFHEPPEPLSNPASSLLARNTNLMPLYGNFSGQCGNNTEKALK